MLLGVQLDNEVFIDFFRQFAAIRQALEHALREQREGQQGGKPGYSPGIPREKELMAVVASVENGCLYCVIAHGAALAAVSDQLLARDRHAARVRIDDTQYGLPGLVFDPNARGSQAFLAFAQEMVQRVTKM